MQSEARTHRINQIVYYSQTQNQELKLFGALLQECHHALEWYWFLNQHQGLPEYVDTAAHRSVYIGLAFQNLIRSFFEESESTILENAILAWKQAHPEEI